MKYQLHRMELFIVNCPILKNEAKQERLQLNNAVQERLQFHDTTERI